MLLLCKQTAQSSVLSLPHSLCALSGPALLDSCLCSLSKFVRKLFENLFFYFDFDFWQAPYTKNHITADDKPNACKASWSVSICMYVCSILEYTCAYVCVSISVARVKTSQI